MSSKVRDLKVTIQAIRASGMMVIADEIASLLALVEDEEQKKPEERRGNIRYIFREPAR